MQVFTLIYKIRDFAVDVFVFFCLVLQMLLTMIEYDWLTKLTTDVT